VAYIPLACLAGILMLVAYHMSEWRTMVSILKITRGSAATALVTVSLTILLDLTVAIKMGLIVATLVFVRRMSIKTNVSFIRDMALEDSKENALTSEDDFAEEQKYRKDMPKGAVMYRIDGPLFFGAVYKFREAMAEIGKPPKVLIIEMQNVPVVDSSGIHTLKEAFKLLKKSGTKFIITGIGEQRLHKFENGGLLDYVPKENFFKTTQEGIELARKLVQ
jgi:SulP family sulfate permease